MKRILTLLLFIPIISKGQIKTFDIPTPNAAELVRFGDIPVSYYTGKADINIPLYSLTVRDMTLPVTLDYNASGVLVNSLPSWLGDNWSLSAGGVITRIVQDVCDEYALPEGDTSTENDRVTYEYELCVNHNYFKSHNVLPQIADFSNVTSNQAVKDSVKLRKCDFSPDIFYFNFLGKIGRFYLGNDGQWKVFCNENLEVIFDYNNTSNYDYPLFETHLYTVGHPKQPKTIKGFIIRDENGVEYHFGGNKNYIEYSTPFFRQYSREFRQYWTANSWYMNKIVDRNGNILFQFEYQRGKFIAQLYNAASNFHYYYRYDATGNHTHGEFYPSSGQYECPYDGVLSSPIYLTRITTLDNRRLEFVSSDANISMTDIYGSMYSRYNNMTTWYQKLVVQVVSKSGTTDLGSYPFHYLQTDDASATAYQYNPSSSAKRDNPLLATRLRQLDNITLYSMGTQTVSGTKYTFGYNYSNRMRLNNVRMKNGSGTNEGLYQLNYYPGLNADYISTATDHWGYYNANPITAYPVDVQGYNNYLIQRNTNSSIVKAGMLFEIIYPTGGKTVFDYEAHDYSSYMNALRNAMVNGSGIAGGVRIKSITNYGTAGNILTTRSFSYTLPENNTQSSGQLYAQPQYYWNQWESEGINPGCRSVLSLFKSSSILPLSNKFGPHVGYSYVKETLGDGSYKLYAYSNLSDAFDIPAAISFSNNTPTPYDVYSERDYRRGCLLSVSAYSNGTVLKQKTDYLYNPNNVEGAYIWTSSLKYDNFITNPYYDPIHQYLVLYSHFIGGVYKLFYPKYDVIKEITTTYYDTSNISDTITYAKRDTTLTVSYGSFNHSVDVRTTKSRTLKRGTDIAQTIYTYPFQSTGIESQLTSSQFFVLPIVTEEKLNHVTSGKKQTIYQNYYGKMLPKCELEWKNGLVADTIITYNGYTGTGAVSSFRQQGQPVTTLNWTNNDCLLSKKTVGGTLITDYTYTPFNQVSSITMPNGDVRYYTYDLMGRLVQITDRNGYVIQKFSYNYINN